ncbi:MAG TPA: hypothetical protein VKX16_12850 [Chloroflexota bacterium]|nr:hypothetical protein [Chloroflexota bacterium]
MTASALSIEELTDQACTFVADTAQVIGRRELFLAALALDPATVRAAWVERGLSLRPLRGAIREWWPTDGPVRTPFRPQLGEAGSSLLAGLERESSPVPQVLDRLLADVAQADTGHILSALQLI